jgi:hypothetical protein
MRPADGFRLKIGDALAQGFDEPRRVPVPRQFARDEKDGSYLRLRVGRDAEGRIESGDSAGPKFGSL